MLADRRQRAREAGWDAIVDVGAREGLEVAIETASRVRVTPEVVEAARTPWMTEAETHTALTAAFRAAGFEVEE